MECNASLRGLETDSILCPVCEAKDARKELKRPGSSQSNQKLLKNWCKNFENQSSHAKTARVASKVNESCEKLKFKGTERRTSKILKPNSLRCSMNEQKIIDKLRDYPKGKRRKKSKKKSLNRPGSASEKIKDRKLLKKSEIKITKHKVFEIDKQLDSL